MADLRPTAIDLEKTANRKAHRTDQYENNLLVLRRGQEVKLKVTLSGDYDKVTDNVILQFSTGVFPRISKGTMVRCSTRTTRSRWPLRLVSVDGRTLTFTLTPDPGAVVGPYRLLIEVLQEVHDGEFICSGFDVPEDIILLFNPFCKDDDVYMSDVSDVEEYVMREVGMLYTSPHGGGRAWNYGQFDPHVLEASLYVLDHSYLATQNHGNPALVLRALSAMINSDDESGVLTGNWSKDYWGGTDPTEWNGSVQILQQFYKRRRAVKYGQCWVFAGVLTTVCRALGIPCRPVTNFSSGHDGNASCTIDMFIDPDGNKTEEGDSIWNFHVWNEAFTKRSDLPAEYQTSDWQVVDATPQEASQGMYRCGPCPVLAVKRGAVHLPYDAAFIFSEVNADQVFWQKTRYGDCDIVHVDTDSVGTRVLTKAPGTKNWRDITPNYKAPEASLEERLTVRQAVRQAVSKGMMDIKSWIHMYGTDRKEDIDLHLKGEVFANGDGLFELRINNSGDVTRELVVTMTLSPRYKDGRTGDELTKQESRASVDPGKEIVATWKVPCKEYFYRLQDDAWLWLWAKVRVPSIDKVLTRSRLLELPKPGISVSVNKASVSVGESFTVLVSFTNPTSVTLTHCVVNMEGPGIYKTKEINIGRHLPPGHSINVSMELTARVPGDREIIASFDSKQLQGISDTTSVRVTY